MASMALTETQVSMEFLEPRDPVVQMVKGVLQALPDRLETKVSRVLRVPWVSLALQDLLAHLVLMANLVLKARWEILARRAMMVQKARRVPLVPMVRTERRDLLAIRVLKASRERMVRKANMVTRVLRARMVTLASKAKTVNLASRVRSAPRDRRAKTGTVQRVLAARRLNTVVR